MFDVIATAARLPNRPASYGRSVSLMDLFGLRRQRQQLLGLSPEQLDDIGISAAEAEAEANRSIWDLPKNWRA